MEATRALDWQEDHARHQYGDRGNLGTLHDKHLCSIPEVVRRAKAARTVIAAISKRVLRNTLLPLPVRQAALACVDGIPFSAAGWWSAPSQRELLLLNARRSRLLRALANVKPGPGGPTDAELRTQLKVPSTSLVMQAARLRYSPRLLRHAPPSLRSLVRLPNASQWRQTTVTDHFDTSKVLSSKLGMLPDPTMDSAAWYDIAHQFPDAWRSLVKFYVSTWISGVKILTVP